MRGRIIIAKDYLLKEDLDCCVRIRRLLHRNPELGFDLPETQKLVGTELSAMGLEWTEQYAPCSAVTYVNPECKGKTLLIRADMDALPILEKSGVDYASENRDYCAACDPITLVFRGKTAHATRYQEGVDAIQMAMHAWEGLKKIEAEEVGNRKHIFSLGYFHGGTAHNVISDECTIRISFRYYDTGFAARVRSRGIALLEEICARFGGTVDIDWNTSAPPVINDEALAAHFAATAKKVAGENCGDTGVSMGSEDFAWFLTKVPGVATCLGTGNAEKGCITTGHTDTYRIDEDAFENAVLALVQFALGI